MGEIKAIVEFNMFCKKNTVEIVWNGCVYSLAKVNEKYLSAHQIDNFEVIDRFFLEELYLTLLLTIRKEFNRDLFLSSCQSIVSCFAKKNNIGKETIEEIFRKVDNYNLLN